MHNKDKLIVATLIVVLILCIQSVFMDTESKVYHDSWVIPIVLATILSFFWN